MNLKGKKFILSILGVAIILAVPGVGTGEENEDEAIHITTIESEGSLEEGLLATQHYWEDNSVLLMAGAEEIDDDLPKMGLEEEHELPVFYVPSEEFAEVSEEELKEMEAEKAVILGSKKELPSEVEDKIEDKDLHFETDEEANHQEATEEILKNVEVNDDQQIIVSGDNFPYAMSASLYAAKQEYSFLTTDDSLPEPVESTMESVKLAYAFSSADEAAEDVVEEFAEGIDRSALAQGEVDADLRNTPDLSRGVRVDQLEDGDSSNSNREVNDGLFASVISVNGFSPAIMGIEDVAVQKDAFSVDLLGKEEITEDLEHLIVIKAVEEEKGEYEEEQEVVEQETSSETGSSQEDSSQQATSRGGSTSTSTTYRGLASFYGNGDGFDGQKTASGETFDSSAYTAAHPSLPMGTKVEVEYPATGQSVTVRINDRGPYAGNRIIDLSRAAADAIGLTPHGVGEVILRVQD